MADHNDLTTPDYANWLGELKNRVQQVQIKAATAVNRELMTFYWELGHQIIEKQQTTEWGSGFLKQLSIDLSSEFPEIKGFSHRNLKYVRQWISFYRPELLKQATSCRPNDVKSKGPQLVAQLDPPDFVDQVTAIPWGHNREIISKCSSTKEALYDVRQTFTHGWSRAVLVHQIESDLFQREGSATSNFASTLPPAQSDLAQQTLKDPYIFDFLTLTKDHNERDLENQLTDIAKSKNPEHPDDLIRNWLRNRNSLELLGIWEQLHNSDFNPVEFDGIRKQSGLNRFTLTPKQWIEKTAAIGLQS